MMGPIMLFILNGFFLAAILLILILTSIKNGHKSAKVKEDITKIKDQISE